MITVLLIVARKWGQWDLDHRPDTGALYGYITEGDLGRSTAYIIPAHLAFFEVEQRMGHKITFLGPEGPLEAVAAQLEDGNWNAREAAIEALNSQADCPKEFPEAMAAQSVDEDSGIPPSALTARSSRPKVPEVPLDAAATRLEDGDGNVRETGIDALSSRPECPEEPLGAVAALFGVPKLLTYSPLMDHLSRSKQGCIVFTTRDRKTAFKLADQNVVEVPEMDENVASQMLRKYLIKEDLVKNKEDVKALLTKLAFLPLALVQAAALSTRMALNLQSICRF